MNEKFDRYPVIECEILFPYKGGIGPQRKVILILDDEDYSNIEFENNDLRNWIYYELERRFGDAGFYLETWKILEHTDLISANGKY